MNFTSDNCYGVSPQIMRAIEDANRGAAASYGDDEWSERLDALFGEVFETECAVVPVATGTAANALGLSLMTPPYGVVLCHEESHINTSECGAVEFYCGGARLHGIAGAAGKISPDGLTAALSRFNAGSQHEMQAAVLSLTQVSEAGTVYTAAEIAELAAIAREAHLSVHMDGARFANAVAVLDAAPADLTWRAGVDILSFGATKNGAMAAEAVVVFSGDRREELRYRRKRGGHLISKSRFLAAQLIAHFENGHWLDLARRANRLGGLVAGGFADCAQAELAWAVQANEVFVWLDPDLDERLRAAGVDYHRWYGAADASARPDAPARILARLVASHATPEEDVERLLSLIRTR